MSIIQEYPDSFKLFTKDGMAVVEVRKEDGEVRTPPLTLETGDEVQEVIDALAIAKNIHWQVIQDLDSK